jgi:O-antigen/teichoic acid export membrane protein
VSVVSEGRAAGVPDDDGPEDVSTGGHPPPANASGRQLLHNIVNSYAGYLIGLAMTLVLTRALLRHLGPGTYGLWVVLLGLVGYLGLLDVGVGTAAMLRVSRLMASHDTDGVADLIRTTWVFFSVSAVLAVAVTVGLAPFLSSILNLGGISPALAGSTLVVLGVMSALMFLSTVPNAVLFGSGRNDRMSQIGVVTLILMQAAQIVAVVLGAGLMAVAVLQTAGVAVTLVISASVVHRITGSSILHGRFSRKLLGELLRFGGVQSVVSLSGMVAYQLDALVIGIILPVAQVAPYNVALKATNLTRTLSTQATNSLLPSYAHFDEVGDRERQAQYYIRAVMGCLVLSVPMVIALAAYGEPILQLWLGKVPPKTYEIMVALGLVTALQLPGHQSFMFLTGVGQNRKLIRYGLVGATVNLAGSVVATYLWGPIGPALGSLPVVLILDSVILPVVVCRYLEVPVGRYVTSGLLPVVPVGCTAGAVALLLLRFHPVHGGVAAILSAMVVCAAAWAVLAVVVSRREPELRDAVRKRLPFLRTRPGVP